MQPSNEKKGGGELKLKNNPKNDKFSSSFFAKDSDPFTFRTGQTFSIRPGWILFHQNKSDFFFKNKSDKILHLISDR